MTPPQVPSSPAPQVPTPPALPMPAMPGPVTDLAGLQTQLVELQVQLSGLKAQWNGLRTQLDDMLRNNPARPGVQQQWANVGVQIAEVEGKVAVLQARIAQAKGLPVGTTVPPAAPPRPVFSPDWMVPISALLLAAFVFPMSIGWARRISRGKPQPASLPHDQASRLERLEHAIDTIAIEVERISEGQRFVTKILAERPAQNAAAGSNGAPASAAAPPLALGAGPMEPIPMAERDLAGQRINVRS